MIILHVSFVESRCRNGVRFLRLGAKCLKRRVGEGLAGNLDTLVPWLMNHGDQVPLYDCSLVTWHHGYAVF